MNSGLILRCSNPLQKDHHFQSKNLSNFPVALRKSYPLTPENAKIYSGCRRDIYRPEAKRARVECDDDYHRAGISVLEQIKKKFSETTCKDDRIQLLTLAPDFWSRRDLMREFGCTEWEARVAKQLVDTEGVFSRPDKKIGKVLPTETIELVQNFYEKDDVSRIMPGMKDFVSVKQKDGKREHIQKRLILGDLSEIYRLFKEKYEHVKIGFTKFTQLRPPHCVLAGTSGTHNVCVCVHHENVKLMLNAIDLESLTKNSSMILKNYHDCIQTIVCANARDECYLGECLDCPNMSKLRPHLLECLEMKDIFEIEYESWFQTDRYTIASKTVRIHEFMDILGEKLSKLKTHDFFAKKQFIFTNDLKENLQEGEFIICCDFAENYAFVIQNSTQSFHWNNNQATIFTVVVYYKENDELKHVSIAIISDNLNHDTISVYEYQKIIITYLKNHFRVYKIYYVTDGAGQHFKNKTSFHNLLFHEKDFGIKAEWHFQATAHGKGGCDGVGANIKRGARKASLQLSSKNHILKPEDLYNWAKAYCKETVVFYSSKESYEKTVVQLKPRLDQAKSIPGTLQYHAIIPIDGNRLMLKKVSTSFEYHVFPKESTKKKQKNGTTLKIKKKTSTKIRKTQKKQQANKIKKLKSIKKVKNESDRYNNSCIRQRTARRAPGRALRSPSANCSALS